MTGAHSYSCKCTDEFQGANFEKRKTRSKTIWDILKRRFSGNIKLFYSFCAISSLKRFKGGNFLQKCFLFYQVFTDFSWQIFPHFILLLPTLMQ